MVDGFVDGNWVLVGGSTKRIGALLTEGLIDNDGVALGLLDGISDGARLGVLDGENDGSLL